MAYRLIRLTDEVRAGINGSGELNIEIDQLGGDDGKEVVSTTDVFIPADAISELFEFLRRHA
ncbi:MULTISPECIES: hypothetical protein [Aurantimonas]|uniref:hypothetical protein n=1 Tax=Aurantimonas TaxID=182269 RepID=UPI003511FAD5